MFISKQEKVGILSRINNLEEMVKSLYEERRTKKEKAREYAKTQYLKKKEAEGWTPEKRAKQSEKMNQMMPTHFRSAIENTRFVKV